MAKLSNINGKFAVEDTGAIRFSDQTGTTGQILKSNGNAAPTWIPQSDIVGAYLPLAGGILTGATSTASGISFTVGGALTGTTATFTGDVLVEDNLYLTDAGTVRGKIQLNASDRDDLDIKVVSLGSNMKFFTVDTERMRIDSSGNLGVGGSPVLKLEVQGTASSPTPFGSAAVNGVVRIASGGTNPMLDIGSNSAAPYEMWLQAHVPANTYGTPISLQPLGGNVGIGEIAPAAKLDVKVASNEHLLVSDSLSSVAIKATNDAAAAYVPMSINAVDLAINADSGGDVGIGTTSPGQKLHVVGNIKTFGNIFLQSNANGFRTVALDTTNGADNQELYLCGGGTASSTRGAQVGVYGNEVSGAGGSVVIVAGNVSTGDIDFLTANTQRMIINNSGNVGIGTTSPLQKLVIQDGDGGGTTGAGIDSRTKLLINANTEAYVTVNVPALSFCGHRYSIASAVKASIELWDYAADPQFRLSSVDGRPLTFATTNIERMRISSVGRVTINTTVVADAMCTIAGNSSNYALNLYADSIYAGIYRYQRFRSGTSIAGGIEGSNQTSVVYNTSSDYRMKKNIKPLENGLDRVCKLKPIKFDWKLNNETTEGFIAHEVQDIFPEAVTGEKDGEDMQGMDYGRITPLLVAAIQELKAEIEILKNK